ncbi:MAG: TIGR03936 family radical SAM-associated protein [Gemmataceae bacterium]|nr:TIGR03936 family radical SAM-associated protein [Gemmataceae bacterium]
MALPPGDLAEIPLAVPPPKGAVDKVRLVVRKDGSLRWLSHHDLLRTFERMLRRAAIPFRRSQGFNPHPRIVFALSLPLGVVGCAEIVELELAEPMEPDEVRARLAVQCPAGLAILSAERIAVKGGVHVVGLCYAVTVPPDRREGARARIEEILAAPECLVQREKPVRRQVDVRPFLRGLRLDPSTGRLEIDLALTPAGTARPDEVLGLLGLPDLLALGAVLERTRLDLREDLAAEPPPAEEDETPKGPR